MVRYVSAHRRDAYGANPRGDRWGYGSIASFNRWTGKPHESMRAIERRLRQKQRLQDKYDGNGGISRRGRKIQGA